MTERNSNFKRLPRNVKITLLVAGVFFILILAFILWPREKGEYRQPMTVGWQTGDVFFSSGTSWKSDVVRIFGNESEYSTSHCGFVMICDGIPMLVHMSTSKNEIVIENVKDYGKINGATSVRAMRIKTAIDTVAFRKNIEQLLAEHKKFDNAFDNVDTEKYYCSELVVRQMHALGVQGLDDFLGEDVVYPQDIEQSNLLVPIK